MISTYKGIKIHYTVEGEGRPIVFLHGFLENSGMWKEILPSFTEEYTCVCIDLLGHGQTENLGYIHTMEDMANAVNMILEQLEIEQAIFIGHSMGGYTALAFLDKFPEMVSGLVLLNSTTYSDSEERKLNRTRAIDLVKNNPNIFIGMAIANLFATENQSKFSEEIEVLKNEAQQTSLQGVIAALEGMKVRKDHRDTLKNFDKPKLMISGKNDPVLSYKQNEKESEYTNTELIVLDGGHMSWIENKGEVISELTYYLGKF